MPISASRTPPWWGPGATQCKVPATPFSTFQTVCHDPVRHFDKHNIETPDSNARFKRHKRAHNPPCSIFTSGQHAPTTLPLRYFLFSRKMT
jgi:hypothetical protein